MEEKMFSLSGKLTSNNRDQFDNIFNFIKNCQYDTKIVLNFENVNFIDSSTLGSLLLLREKSKEKDLSLVIQNPVGDVSKIFDLSNFYELFEINHQ